MIARPLNLEARLRPPPRNLDWLFLVNGAMIMLFFTLFGSRFVLAPGLAITLPTMQAGTMTAAPASAVVSVPRANMILFEDSLLTLPQLRTRFAGYVKGRRGLSLLVRPDRDVPMQTLVEIAEAAAAAGFAPVTIAAESGTPVVLPAAGP